MVTRTPEIAAPISAPRQLTALVSEGTVSLQWSEPIEGVELVSFYNVYRSTYRNSGYSWLAGGTREVTSYREQLPESLLAVDAVYYRVRAEDGEGRFGRISRFAVVKPRPADIPPLPQELAAKLLSGGRILLSWQDVSDPELSGYNVYRRDAAEADWQLLNPELLSGTTYVDYLAGRLPAPEEGRSFAYAVSSEGVTGVNSGHSAVVSIPYSMNGELTQEELIAELMEGLEPGKSISEGILIEPELLISQKDNNVMLLWEEEAAEQGVSSYNIYRSTGADGPFDKLGRVPLGEARFTDRESYRLAPRGGERPLFYRINSVDADGEEGLYISLQRFTVEGEPTMVTMPKEFKLPAKSDLRIQGRKSITGMLEDHYYFQKPEPEAGAEDFRNPDSQWLMNQELRAKIDGTIGERIKVHVDWDDSQQMGGMGMGQRRQQEISISYTGEEEDVLQEVVFGDVDLRMGRTVFAVENPSKKLFGLKAKINMWEDISWTSLYAQTRGYSEMEVFVGATAPVTVELKDYEHVRGKYFYITRDRDRLPLKPGGAVWFDDGVVTNNGAAAVTVTNGSDTYYFTRLSAGNDYYVDVNEGLLTFIYPVSMTSSNIAVSFRDKNDNPIGFSGDLVNGGDYSSLEVAWDGYTTVDEALIYRADPAALTTSAHYVTSYYNLLHRNIMDPEEDNDFAIRVIDSSNRVVGEWYDREVPGFYELDTDEGILMFEEKAHFDPSRPDELFPFLALGTAPDGYEAYDIKMANLKSYYTIQVFLKDKVPFYRLKHPYIIEGSEVVIVDGQRYVRGKDYVMDYFSGVISFSRPQEIDANSRVKVSYDYLPFIGGNPSQIAGSRLEYSPTDRLLLGGTYLYKWDKSSTIGVPDVGTAPGGLHIFDMDGRIKLDKENMSALGVDKLASSVVNVLPGVAGVEVPVEIDIQGEVAHSVFNPNRYSAELDHDRGGEGGTPGMIEAKEYGVAMIDNMESVGGILSFPVSKYSYLPSAPPGYVPESSSYSAHAGDSNRNAAVTISETQEDTLGGHIYDREGRQEDKVRCLRLEYDDLSSTNWGGYQFLIDSDGRTLGNARQLEIWVKHSGAPVTVYVDFGFLAEDINKNGVLDTEDADGDGVWEPESEDTGVPVFYQGSQTLLWGENNSVKHAYHDSEDFDGDGSLHTEDNCYSYSFLVDWGETGGDNGWKKIVVPMQLASSSADYTVADTGSVPVAYRKHGLPSDRNVRTGRVWITGGSATPGDGYLMFETISIVDNDWLLKTESEAGGVDVYKFDVSVIDQELGIGYIADGNFLREEIDAMVASGNATPVEAEQRIKESEQALRITYDINADDRTNDAEKRPLYYVTRRYSTMDFSDYRELRFDLYCKRRQEGPGQEFNDRIFIRLGPEDEGTYYQYVHFLGDQDVGDGWAVISIPLSEMQGQVWKNYPATAYNVFDNVVNISIGVLSDKPGGEGGTGELWINNLRLVSPETQRGTARRVVVQGNLGDGGLVTSASYTKIDQGFMRLDQVRRDQQHYRRQLYDLRSDRLALLGSPLRNKFFLSYDELTNEDKFRKDILFYGRPERRSRTYGGYLGHNYKVPRQLGSLTTRVDTKRTDTSIRYSSDYVAAQESAARRSYQGMKYYLKPRLEYKLPNKLFGRSIGQNTVAYMLNYEYEKTEYPDLETPFFERYKRERQIRVTGAYQPLPKVALNLRGDYTYVDMMGNTVTSSFSAPPTQQGRGPGWSSNYTSYQEKMIGTGSVSYTGIKGVTPGVDYRQNYSRLYYRDRAEVNNNLTGRVSLTPAMWWEPLTAYQVRFTCSRAWNCTSLYEYFDRYFTGRFSTQKKVFFDESEEDRLISVLDLMWIDPVEERAKNATRSVRDSVQLSVLFFKHWKLSPTANWEEAWRMYNYTLPSESQSESYRVNLYYVDQEPLLRLPGLKLTTIDLTGTLSQRKQKDSDGMLFSGGFTRGLTFNLPFYLVGALSGNLNGGTAYVESMYRQVESWSETNNIGVRFKWVMKKIYRVRFIPFLPRLGFKQDMEIYWGYKWRSYFLRSDYEQQNQDTRQHSGEAGFRLRMLDNLNMTGNYEYYKTWDRVDRNRSDRMYRVLLSLVFVF